jgi:ribonuclease Y
MKKQEILNWSYGKLETLNLFIPRAMGGASDEETYAIQAGREVRVFVKSDETDDLQAHDLARDIAKKIETELKYPGEIKVNVIRELRVTEYAR